MFHPLLSIHEFNKYNKNSAFYVPDTSLEVGTNNGQ